MPSCFDASDNSKPYIEISDKGGLTYVIKGDRGDKRFIEAVDLDHLLFIVFENVTHCMAIDFVANNTDVSIDIRRQQFIVQLSLLDKLNNAWRINVENKYYEGAKQIYFRELLGNGFLYSEALQKVREKYP